MNRATHRRRSIGASLVLVVLALTVACGDGNGPATDLRSASAPAERRPNPDDMPPLPAPENALPPVEFEEATRPLSVTVLSRSGYTDAEGLLVVDVMEEDYLNLALSIEDAEGHPVRGALPSITTERDSRFIRMADDGVTSDNLGTFSFSLLGGTMGEERVRIEVGETVEWLILNVVSRRASGYGWLRDVEGVLDWDLLLRADIEWGREEIFASFPDEVLANDGETVRLIGFALPLEATRKQKHFVLVSNPPGCFFHVPGGPAGAVEVFAKKPLEIGYDPVVLEGRFEALESNDISVVYRLHDARYVAPPSRPSDS